MRNELEMPTLSKAETRRGQITQYARNDLFSKESLNFQDYKV